MKIKNKSKLLSLGVLVLITLFVISCAPSETTGPAEESVVSGAAITGAVVAEAGI
ncbi:hypothetical protein GOV03_04935, partial [Candidatus Woesearchaeota archaeon]|nr:hypothetical protein [Candidatus Woesearchaeota archaeon]